MRNVRKKLPQLLIAVTLVVLAIIWIIHSDFLAPVDRLPDNHGLEARRLSLERTLVPSQDPHTKPRNPSERKQYKQSFAGKICANAIFTRGSGSASITVKSENKPRGLYFSKALFEELIFGGAYLRREIWCVSKSIGLAL